MNQLQSLKPSIKLSIVNPETDSNSEFGPGIANLCLGVRNMGSLNAAAKSMGMAYSKAWRIVKDTESALNLQLLDRDGAHGSTLTPEGDALLDTYFFVSKHLQSVAEETFTQALKQ